MLHGPNVISDKNQLLHDILDSSEEKQSYKLTGNYSLSCVSNEKIAVTQATLVGS